MAARPRSPWTTRSRRRTLPDSAPRAGRDLQPELLQEQKSPPAGEGLKAPWSRVGYALYSLKQSTPLWPPKPSEFEIAARIRPGTALWGT